MHAYPLRLRYQASDGNCQIQNDHLARLGAIEIPEGEYLRRLEHALTLDRSFV